MMNSFASAYFGGGAPGRGQGPGPLDVDNWQLNRVAELRVDSVPAANIFMKGFAMS
jgi:hypothetical protein